MKSVGANIWEAIVYMCFAILIVYLVITHMKTKELERRIFILEDSACVTHATFEAHDIEEVSYDYCRRAQ